MKNWGQLFVVGTPIGNLADITFRAVETLREVDLILAEDTRKTRRLLDHYGIETKMTAYFQHSDPRKHDFIFTQLAQGKNLALVSEAGTPGLADPGGLLISELVRRGREAGQEVIIVPIPGPSAVSAAVSISGLKGDRFLFLGFVPKKKGRVKIFRRIINSEETVIFYESPYRLLKTLGELDKMVASEGAEPRGREMVVCREMTKKFEEIVRGSVSEIYEYFSRKPSIKGELVILYQGTK